MKKPSDPRAKGDGGLRYTRLFRTRDFGVCLGFPPEGTHRRAKPKPVQMI